MVYVGIDLHRKRSQVAVLDSDGEQLLSRRIVNDPETFLDLLQGLGDDAQIALEATYGWEWLADLLEEAGYDLHLSHPLRTKAIAAAPREDGRGRRADARASAPGRPAAGGVHRPA
jgi:transposase